MLRKHLLLAAAFIGFAGYFGQMRAQTDCCTFAQADSITTVSTYMPSTLAISPTGLCFAVAGPNTTSNQIFSFGISDSCKLSISNTVSTDILLPLAQLTYSSTGSCLGVAGTSGFGTYPVSASDCSLSLLEEAENMHTAIAFSNQNCYCVVASGTLTFGSLDTSNCTLSVSNTSSFPGGGDYPQAAFSPNSSCFAAIDSTNNRVCAIGVTDCVPAETGFCYSLTTGGTPTYLTFSSTGCLAVASSNGYVTFFTLDSTTCQPIVASTPVNLGLDNPIQASFSPDGSCLAVAFQGETSGGVNLYSFDQSSCSLLSTTPTQQLTFADPVRGAGFTGHGCLLVVTDRNIFSYTLSCPTTLALFECCPGNVSPSSVVSYTLSIKNTGEALANDVKLVDTLPSCLTFLSATSEDPWSPFTVTGLQVSGTLSSLPAGAITTVTITAQAHCCSGKKILNEMVVSASNLTTPQTARCCTKVV